MERANGKRLRGENDEWRITNDLITRIAEIEVNDAYLEEYLAAAHNVGTKSVDVEPSVICIFSHVVLGTPVLITKEEPKKNQGWT